MSISVIDLGKKYPALVAPGEVALWTPETRRRYQGQRMEEDGADIAAQLLELERNRKILEEERRLLEEEKRRLEMDVDEDNVLLDESMHVIETSQSDFKGSEDEYAKVEGQFTRLSLSVEGSSSSSSTRNYRDQDPHRSPCDSKYPVIMEAFRSVKDVSLLLVQADPSISEPTDDISAEFLNIGDTAFVFEENIKLLDNEITSVENMKAQQDSEEGMHNCQISEVRGAIQVFFELIQKSFEVMKQKMEEIITLKSKKGGSFLSIFSPSSAKLRLLSGLKEVHHDVRSLIPLLPLLLLFYKQKHEAALVEHFNDDAVLTKLTHTEWRETSKIQVEPFWYKYHPSLMKLKSMMSLAFTTIGEAQKLPPSVMSHAYSIKTAVECAYQPDSAQQRMREIHQDLNADVLQQIWNLLDYPLFATLNGLFRLPSVAVSQPFQIPGPLEDFPIVCRMISHKTLPFSISHLIPTHLKPSVAKTLYKSVSGLQLSKLVGSDGKPSGNIPTLPVILHFHGGGFISGSSAMHENYLRDWAIGTGAIIVSVDYRLSPKFKYPTAHLECFEVYKWLVTGSDLGFNISKITLVGDSAGGNLAIGVTMKAITEGIRVPDGLIAHYPCLDMTVSPTASRIIFTNDIMVSSHMMKLCLDAYVTSDIDLRDPLISPLYAPRDLVSKFPRTHITSCEYDPLSDEAFAFADKLRCANVNVEQKIYHGVPHGILSLSIPEARAPIADSIIILKEMLEI